ncbi:isoprenylcysteine carboxylmethyltransferase family protein [Roseibium sp. RKSG952]|uniref:methyltransferase family protein n=1 Tax=Roseibium sp. RKSG952 TaxID=2529384 RepID=UPI0012BCD94C|nr:isoprenylcysteine carboxylmethyltransferase family protein [Roseibium sp. RKSG952]MTH97014.1 isoprenylcysteine carboxylmethyltransferase family protein [Roseibium sp. RKSG952]
MHLKVPPPVVGAFAFFLIWLLARLTAGLTFTFPGQSVGAAVLAAAGLSLDMSSLVAFLKARTTILPTDPSRSTTLVQSGLYRISRNPMYLGLAVLIAAFGLWLGSPLALLVLGAFIWYITEFQIKPEEHHLRQLFGAEYETYCRRVRRWI